MEEYEEESLKPFFNFKFGGNNLIDYKTLFGSQSHFVSALNIIQQKHQNSGDFQIKVGTFKDGSFDVPYFAEFYNHAGQLLKPFLTKDNAEALAKTLGAVAALINIHKFLKGEKPKTETPKDDNTTELSFGSNNKIQISNFHLTVYKGDSSVIQHIEKAFEHIENDEEVTNVELYTKDKTPIVKLNREDISALTHKNPYHDKEEKETVSKVKVFVKKANFYKDKKGPWKWEFIWNQRVIKAVINDKNFEEVVKAGKNFRQGTRLIVDLKRKFTWKHKLKMFVITNYEITNVYDSDDTTGIQEQGNLFDLS
jgi:hypothetical protein